MADKNCPKCQGRGRVPWPEAGMLQDCDCVRAARDPAPTTDPADPWPLPAGWSWQICVFQGYLPHFAVQDKTLANVWVSNGVLRATPTAGGPELERVKAAVAKRNNFTPA